MKDVWEQAIKEISKNINAREVEKVFLATFHRGWNEMQVMCQMEKFHKRLLKLSKNVLRRLNKLQTIICIGTQKKQISILKVLSWLGWVGNTK